MPHAHLVPAGEEPLYGLNTDFTSQIPSDVLAAKRQAVTDEALARMAPAVVPPLIAWGDDIKQKAADLLMYELKSWLGLAPQEAAVGDENVIIRAQLAREYFDAIGDGKIDPPGLVDSSADGAAGGAISPVESDDPRCW